jgi:thiol-disulfide isomerase/thioredoxin
VTARRGVGIGALLAACAAFGFLVYRLGHPPPSLYPVSAVAPPPQAPPPAPQAASAEPAPRIPETLPDLTLPGLDGQLHALSQWRGHTVVLNFWASWCEPCRREIPLLKQLRREHAADGVEVVGIAIDFRDAAQKYAHDSKIDYPVLVGEDGGYAAVAAFGMEPVLPFTVFADGHGRIVNLKIGELREAETQLVLARLKALNQGRITLQTARREIAEGTAKRFGAAPADAAAH